MDQDSWGDAAIRCRIPNGLRAGDVMVVSVDGHEFDVVVPTGARSGDVVCVNPPAEWNLCGESLDVDVGDARPGEELLVQHEGLSFSFIVPHGHRPGSSLSVEIPDLQADSSGEWSEEAAAATSWVDAEEQRSVLRIDEFFPGEDVEVLRSSGGYTPATVEVADWESGTYTVRLLDGRLKYMVEESDMRHGRAGTYEVGARVSVLLKGVWRTSRIVEYDYESETYCVRCLHDGKLAAYVAADDMAAIADAPRRGRRGRW